MKKQVASKMSQLQAYVEGAKSSLPVPSAIGNPFYRLTWMQGRDYAVHRLSIHTLRNTGQPLPHLNSAPKGLIQEKGTVAADFWLAGYETAMNYVEDKIRLIFV